MADVNLKSAFRLTTRIGKGMGARGSGSIINVAPAAGLRPQPGSVLYSMSEYFWRDEVRREAVFGRQPVARTGHPEEIAEIAVLLAGDGCPYLTGGVIVADGGFLLA
jgi:NAD(P)-dependent dehydrogenase (short-subunit alcohol dehydrogenase family)